MRESLGLNAQHNVDVAVKRIEISFLCVYSDFMRQKKISSKKTKTNKQTNKKDGKKAKNFVIVIVCP